MRNRRCAIGGLALLATLSLTVAGCAQRPRAADRTESSPTPASPKDVLLSTSLSELRTTTHKYTMKDVDSTQEGVVDPKARKASLTLHYTNVARGNEATLTLLSIQDDAWMKVDLRLLGGKTDVPALPKQWMRLDKTKLQNSHEFQLDNVEPVGAGEVFEAIVTAEAAGERRYRGTVDLNRATDSKLVDYEHVRAMGDKATSVPFEATVDEKNRLVSLKLDAPAAGTFKATTWQVTYLDYGVAASLDPPAANEVVPAPPVVYELFNS